MKLETDRKNPDGKKHAVRVTPEKLADLLGYPPGWRVYVAKLWGHGCEWGFAAEPPVEERSCDHSRMPSVHQWTEQEIAEFEESGKHPV